MSFLKNFFVEEDGQDMVEYGLVVAGIVLGGAAIMLAYSNSVKAAFVTLQTDITTAL